MRRAAFFNGILLASLALGLAVWSFLSSSAQDVSEDQDWIMEGDMVLDQALQVTDLSTFRLHGRDSVILLPETEATVHYSDEKVTVELQKGSVLFSTLADDFSVAVLTPFARVDSQHSTAITSLNAEGTELQVYSITHPSLVTFVKDGQELNALNVPSSYRMKVPASKIIDLLAKLRLTKLAKEFPVFMLTDGDLTPAMNTALTAVQAAYDDSAAAALMEIQKNIDFGPGLTGGGARIFEVYHWFRDALTLLPSAQLKLENLEKKEALIYAMTQFLYGDPLQGQRWLDQWVSAPQDPEEVRVLYASLFAVLPGDALYPVKAAAGQVLYPHEDPLLSLRRQYGQVESLLDRASLVEAGEAYKDYQAQFEVALEDGFFDEPSQLSTVSREYMLLELMLRGNALFYSTASTQLLKNLEDKILILAGSAQDVDEERLAFVQSKLRFLQNLVSFVAEKRLDVNTATDLANELILDANVYISSLSSKVAVVDYFIAQLEDYRLAVQFMNSPEFSSYTSFEEGLEAYRAKAADLDQLNDYLQNLRLGQQEAATLSEQEAKIQVQDDLYTHGIQYVEVLSLGDMAHRLFQIKGARTGGYPFTANYDRETQILYDVTVNTVRFSTGLALADANAVIVQAMATQGNSDDSVVEEEPMSSSSASLTESVAIDLVRSQFRGVGLDPDRFTFTVVDLQSNLFTFKGTMLRVDLPVSGTYDATKQKVSEVVWELNRAPQTLPDLLLEDFEEALQVTYDALNS